MKLWKGVGLCLPLLTLGLFVSEGHAGKPTGQQVLALKQFQATQLTAFKELRADHKAAFKDLKGDFKQGELSAREFRSQVKALKQEFRANVKAWKASARSEKLAFINNGYKVPGNGNGNSVPIPGTLLLFAGGFAGVMCWRARQPAA
jgi:hypothetical protein